MTDAELSHAPWSPEQINHARFVRACVLKGLWTDGETPEELVAEGKHTHKMIHSDGPIGWTRYFARTHEERPIKRRGGGGFDPAQSGSA